MCNHNLGHYGDDDGDDLGQGDGDDGNIRFHHLVAMLVQASPLTTSLWIAPSKPVTTPDSEFTE